MKLLIYSFIIYIFDFPNVFPVPEDFVQDFWNNSSTGNVTESPAGTSIGRKSERNKPMIWFWCYRLEQEESFSPVFIKGSSGSL